MDKWELRSEVGVGGLLVWSGSGNDHTIATSARMKGRGSNKVESKEWDVQSCNAAKLGMGFKMFLNEVI